MRWRLGLSIYDVRGVAQDALWGVFLLTNYVFGVEREEEDLHEKSDI